MIILTFKKKYSLFFFSMVRQMIASEIQGKNPDVQENQREENRQEGNAHIQTPQGERGYRVENANSQTDERNFNGNHQILVGDFGNPWMNPFMNPFNTVSMNPWNNFGNYSRQEMRANVGNQNPVNLSQRGMRADVGNKRGTNNEANGPYRG